jgi:hypothetical protein
MIDVNKQNQDSTDDAVKGATWGCFLIGGVALLMLFIVNAITGFISMQDRAKEVAVRRNMEEMQKRVEQYSQSHKGYFPTFIDTTLSRGMAFENPYKLNGPFFVTMTDTVGMTMLLVQGQIAYMPLDITSMGAKRYGILGKSTQKNVLMKYRLSNKI